MTTFLEFLSAAADFALTLNLKAAIVRGRLHGHADAHAPTRRQIAPEGKGPALAARSGNRPAKESPAEAGLF